MKKIGFVDYYISEWHANNYPKWIKNANEKLGYDYEVAYAWAEKDVSSVDGRTTEQWCKEFGVQKCETIEELCEKSDYILVLAPSDPETHLRYAEKVLQYKKRTYIDKTFAPDYATAKKIVDLGEKYGTPFFSTSALRYADEYARNPQDPVAIITTGGGSNIAEYIIHQIEIVEKALGRGATSVLAEKQANQYIVTVGYDGKKSAKMIWAENLPFTMYCEDKDGKGDHLPVNSDFFATLLEKILTFYQTGEKDFENEDTLEVMKIRTGVIKGVEKPGEKIKL